MNAKLFVCSWMVGFQVLGSLFSFGSVSVQDLFSIKAVHAATGINQAVNYQGKLMDSAGNLVADGNYSIKFTIYNQSAGGTQLWSASTTNGLPAGTPAALDVTVNNGLFSILLGDINNSQVAFPEGLFNNDSLYLGITIGADAEMTPRKRLAAVPYAFNSQTLQGQYASNTVSNTGGDLFALRQASADAAASTRTALYIETKGASNLNDFLIRASDSISDVFTVSRQGNVTTTGNLTVNGSTKLNNTLHVSATSTLADLALTGRVNSDLLPYITDTYLLGNSTYRWLGVTAQNINAVNVSSTNIDALGYVSTTNLYSDTALLGNVTSTNLYNSGVVSTTSLYVNGVAITGAGATPTWQQVTDVGATTNNWIQFAGATSTDNIVPNLTNSLTLGTENYQWLGIFAQNADFTNVSTTNLDASGYIVTNNLTATNADLTNVSSTNIDASGYITANTLNSNTANLGNVTSTNLYNSGVVSTTSLYVNGVAVTGIETQDFQDVTDLGVATTNWIQFAGATSTNNFLPGTTDLYTLGSSAYRWANLFAVNGNVINVSSTNIDASGYITANTLNSNTALLGNVTTTNLYNSGVVSTTSLYVNGTQITGLESQDLQDVTDLGAVTTNWIQFAGATSTNNLVPTSTNLYSLGTSVYRWSDVWGVAMHIGTSTWDLTQGTNGRFMVGNNNLERLTITVDGNVGIGTSTPGANLVVNDGTILNYAGNSIWQSAADEDTHATFDSTMVEYNGKMYVFGGLSYDPDTFTYYTTSSLRIYDPATDTWEISSVLDTQYERYSHGAVVWDDKMLVFGGYDENFNATSSLRIYDFISETWSSGASANSNQAAHSVVLSGGTLIAYGGDDGSGFVDIVQIYDYDTDSWSYGASNSIRQFGHSAVVYGTKMYVFGGEDDDTGDRLDDIYIYDIKNDIWSSGTEDTGNFRRFHEAVVLDNKMYVFGGQDPDIDFLSDLRVYDFLSDSWSAGYSDPAFPRNSFSMAVYDGVIYVTGGLDSYSEPALITTRYLDTTNLDIVDYIASLRNMGTSELTFKSDAVLNLDIGKWSIMEGDVGIGLLNPTEDLDVYGNIQNILYQQQAFPVVATSSFANGCSGSITGGRVVGDYIYFAQTGGCQFLVAEASNPRRINPIGSAAGSNADNPLIIGNYLYLPAEEIYIYDISNPASEVMVDTYNTNLDFVYDIERYGNYILVANNGNDELTVLDITNPISPVEVANVGVGTSPWALAVQGAYAYTADQDGNSVSIVNVSNPLDPTFIDSVFLEADFRPFDVAVSGRYAYAVGSYNFGDAGDLYVIDIDNPNFASVATTLRVTAGEGGLNEIIVSGRYAYISSDSGIHVIDLIDPEDPVLLGSVDGNFQGAVLNGRYLYGTNSDNGLVYTIDVHGAETNGLLAHSAELGTLNVRQSSMFADNIFAQGGLSVGSPGIYSMGSLGVYATTSLMDLAVNGRVNSNLLPYITDTYSLGNSTYRWLGLNVATVTTTNLSASGYVSTTSLYVNGTQITGVEAQDFQDVTDLGVATTNWIQFAGATSTDNIVPNLTNSLTLGTSAYQWANIFSQSANFTYVSTTHLDASGYIVTNNLTATNADLTNVSSTNIDASGYISADSLTSNTANLGNVTTTNLYNSGVVSTTSLYVNGVAVTGIEAQDFQDVTDLGVATTNWIQFAGATSTNHFLPGTNNLFNLGSLAYRWANLFAVNGNFTGTVTTTNLFASGYVSTTSLYVNGTQITGATPTLQNVTDAGYITNDAIGFAGASSTGHLLPTVNVTYDLGSSSFRWRNLYASNGIFTNVSSTNIDALGYVSTTNLYSSFGLLGNVTTTNIYNSGTVSTTALYVNGVQITGGGSGAQDLQDVTDEGYVTTNPIRVAGATSTDQVFVLGSQDAPQLIVQANATQDMENPLVQFRNSAGTPIGGIHTNDQSNIFAGFESGAFITTGTYNTALGFRTLYNSYSDITGGYNTAIGAEAMWGYSGSDMTGYDNTAVGYRALATLSSGYGNTSVGYGSLADNTTGHQNNAFGWGALGDNTTGLKNVAIGVEALTNNTNGESNTSVGNESMFNNNGDDNVAVGKWAMRLSTTADQAVGIGASALATNNATGTTGVGYHAVYSNTSGINISGVGHLVMENNSTGSNNTAMGASSLYYNQTGSGNTSLGSYALHGFTGTSHSNNTGVGYNSLFAVRTGSANTALGGGTLYALTTGASNTAIGYAAGDNITTGSNNITIGSEIDAVSAAGNNQLNIGNVIYGDLSGGNIGIGDSSPAALFTVGSGDLFRIDSNGNVVRINNVAYSWPGAQGGADTYLRNDGSGNLTWTAVAGSSATPTLQQVTDEGYITNDAIGVAGVSSTGHILPTATLTYDLGSSSNRWKDVWASSTYIGSSTWNLRQNASGYFTIANVGGSERVTVDTSGNVGIGDTSPAALFTVGNGDLFQVNSSGRVLANAGASGAGNLAYSFVGDTDTGFYASAANEVTFQTGATSRISINSSGRLTALGSANTTQLSVRANAAQTNANPLVLLETSAGAEMARIHTDNANNIFVGAYAGQVNNYAGGGSQNSFFGSSAGVANTTGGSNSSFGYRSLWSNNTGSRNSAFGSSALNSNQGGSDNNAFGENALITNISGGYNVAFGTNALYYNTTSSNSALGYRAAEANSTGSYNTAIGFRASAGNQTGSYNTSLGYRALTGVLNNSNSGNTAIGTNVLQAVTTGNNNTAVGYNAAASQITAIQGTAVGVESLFSNTASYSTGLGYRSAYSNTSGLYNTAIGHEALYPNQTGTNNTAVGYQSLYGAGGTYNFNNNTAVGYQSMYNMQTDGNANTAIGSNSLYSVTTGDYNTAVGYYAGRAQTTGAFMIAIGYEALYNATSTNRLMGIGYRSAYSNTWGADNVGIGYTSLYYNQVGDNNTAVGNYSLLGVTGNSHSNNTAVGYSSGRSITIGSQNALFGHNAGYSLTSGNYNTILGYNAGYLNTGGYNVIVGATASDAASSGAYNVALGYAAMTNFTGAGGQNTSVGYSSMSALTDGTNNTGIGESVFENLTTGDYNTAVGRGAGSGITTTNYNTFLGYSAGATAAYTNSAAIGNSASVNASNKMRFGNGSVTVYEGQVDWTFPSDSRIKTNVVENPLGLSFVNQIRPVKYESIYDLGYTRDGFIAQEVRDTALSMGYTFSGVEDRAFVESGGTELLTMSYSPFDPIFVKAIQEIYASSSPLFTGINIDPNFTALGESFLSIDTDGNLAYKGATIKSQGTSTTSTQAFSSHTFSFMGSAWDMGANQEVRSSFNLINNTMSASSSEFTLTYSTGTSFNQKLLTITNSGDVKVTGDLHVGRKLYLGSKSTGESSTSTYIFVDDTLSPTSTYISTNADGWQSEDAYDYAERYESSEDLVPGDIVTVDPDGVNMVKRATSPSDILIGIVSTKPGFVTGRHYDGWHPIALAGRVPTRVSTMNGPIRAGDYITATQIPGVGAKAKEGESIIGIALESYNSPQEGLISVFVKNIGANQVNNTYTTIEYGPEQPAETPGVMEFAMIKAGQKEVNVIFDSLGAFPSVIITPYGSVTGAYYVTNVKDTGFTIVLSEEQSFDLLIYYEVKLPKGNKVILSDGTVAEMDSLTGQVAYAPTPTEPTPEPEPEVTPEPEATPEPEPEVTSEPETPSEPETLSEP